MGIRLNLYWGFGRKDYEIHEKEARILLKWALLKIVKFAGIKT